MQDAVIEKMEVLLCPVKLSERIKRGMELVHFIGVLWVDHIY